MRISDWSSDVCSADLCREPFRSPYSRLRLVDMRQGLEGHTGVIGIAKAATQVLPVAAHRQGRRADRAADVEPEALRVVVAAELQRHPPGKHRLPLTGGSANNCAADPAAMDKATRPGKHR